MIIDEVRAAELANLNAKDPEEAEAQVRDRLEVFLREHLTIRETPGEEEKEEKPDDFLSLPDPSANLNLGERWKWKPGADN